MPEPMTVGEARDQIARELWKKVAEHSDEIVGCACSICTFIRERTLGVVFEGTRRPDTCPGCPDRCGGPHAGR